MIFKLLKYFFSLIYWEKASLEKVKRMQLKKFREIFEYARENSAFYRDLYKKHGILDLKIESWEDVEKIPVIDKYDIRNTKIEDFLTVQLSDKLNEHATSGSSGEPLKIYFNKYEDYTAHVRVFYTLWRVARYKPWHKITMITRYEEDDSFQVEGDISILKTLQKRFRFFEREIISIYSEPDYIIDKILTSKPHILWSTPSILEIVCNRMAERNVKFNIPYLYFTSENLSIIQYEKFKKYLSPNIVDMYGTIESPTISFELNKSGIKTTFPNSNLVELINKRMIGNKEVGDIILTNLINYTMPIIRYDIKDLGSFSTDDINVPHKYIGDIIGRTDDILDFPDGEKFVHHYAFEMFYDFIECDHFKFEQKGNETIRLLLKANKKFTEEEIRGKAQLRWNKRFAKYPLHIEFVDKFEINPKTGKFKNIEKINK